MKSQDPPPYRGIDEVEDVDWDIIFSRLTKIDIHSLTYKGDCETWVLKPQAAMAFSVANAKKTPGASKNEYEASTLHEAAEELYQDWLYMKSASAREIFEKLRNQRLVPEEDLIENPDYRILEPLGYWKERGDEVFRFITSFKEFSCHLKIGHASSVRPKFSLEAWKPGLWPCNLETKVQAFPCNAVNENVALTILYFTDEVQEHRKADNESLIQRGMHEGVVARRKAPLSGSGKNQPPEVPPEVKKSLLRRVAAWLCKPVTRGSMFGIAGLSAFAMMLASIILSIFTQS